MSQGETKFFADAITGTSYALDQKNFADLNDGDFCKVNVLATKKSWMFVWSATDTNSATAINYIHPHDIGTNDGSWVRYDPYSEQIDHDTLSNYVAAKHQTTAQTRTDTGELVMETRTADAASPTLASIWMRTDLA
jgi:hypothetical protein